MRRPHASFALVALVIIALAAASLAPQGQSAAAATDLITLLTLTPSGPVDPGRGLGIGKRCPDGTGVVGVGFSGVTPPLYLVGTEFDHFRGPEGGAMVTVKNAGRGARTFTAYVLCLAQRASETTWKQTRTEVPKGQTGTGTVSCPQDTKRIAGAGSIRAWELVPPTELTASYSTKRGWTATFRNTEGAKADEVWTFVSCAYNAQLRVEVVKQTGIWAPTGVTTKRLPCPRGMEVAGGGYFVWPFGPHQEWNRVLTVIASRPETTPDREYWTVRVSNIATGTQQFSAYAVCIALT